MANKIQCLIRKKLITETPEEKVRQEYLKDLIKIYNYSEDQISLEVPVKMGSTYAKKKADIVVYEDKAKIQIRLIVENKKPNRKDGLDQLHSYMNATGAIFGVWTNGVPVYQLREDPNKFRTINAIPKKGEDIADIDNPLTRKDLIKIEDLISIVKDCENEIALQQGVDFFNEIFKIIFTKIYDEKTNLGKADSKCEFRIKATEQAKDGAERIKSLFAKASKKWSGIFDESEPLKLNNYNIVYTASSLQNYFLLESDIDVIGSAFEAMVNPDFKGDLGQYFTPRQVVKSCVEMLDPKEDEKVADPACGSGGFLIFAMDHVYKTIEKNWDKIDEIADHKKDYAQQMVYGLDYDDRLVKVCKAYMLIWGDGRSNIKCQDALDEKNWPNETKKDLKNIDLVFSNPPFSGDLTKTEVLSQYDLSFKGDPSLNKIQNKQTKPVLFIEKCLRILKPGGRCCIVLPQGILNNLNDSYIREYIDKNFRILAVVGLEVNTFKPYTTPKTSLMFLQKWNKNKLDNYKIFTAVSKKSGKDKRGKNVFIGQQMIKGFKIEDPNSDIKENNLGNIDTDLYEIVKEFKKFAKSEKLDFIND